MWSRKQSKHLHTSNTYKGPYTNFYFEVRNILEAAYVFTTYQVPGTTFQAQKKWFLVAINIARGVRFLLRFNMDLFLAQCAHLNLFLAFAHLNITKCPGTRTRTRHVSTRVVCFIFGWNLKLPTAIHLQNVIGANILPGIIVVLVAAVYLRGYTAIRT